MSASDFDAETVSLDWNDAGTVATLTVDRPDKLNSLNAPTLEAIPEALDAARDDARALVVTGAGEKAFVAGADIAHMAELGVAEAYDYCQLGHAVMDAVESFPAPVVAAVNGYAFGGGCELALASDIRVASENALIGQTEIDLGIVPGWGGTQRLARLVDDETARRMVFLGERLDAEACRDAGLVGEVVSHGETLDRALELAERIAEKPQFALRGAKEALNQVHEAPQSVGLEYEKRVWSGLFGTHDQRE
ncbi:MAG: enoyl-CoA hydratase/isomerase family protein, partial [Haloglomus sp.]